MGFNFNFSFGQNQVTDVTRDREGNYFYSLFNGTKANKFKNEKAKYDKVISNPACLKVITFICDTYSQVHFNTEKEENFLYSYKKKPNEWQSWTDLFWEHRFWLSLGNAYLYIENDVWYYLKPYGIEITSKQKEDLKSLNFSAYGSLTKKNIKKGSFKYLNDDGKTLNLDLKNLYIFSDLSNGVSGNWFKGDSRFDALYKVINNSELALDAEGINLEFAGKFVLSGQHDANDISSTPMGEREKISAEQSLRSGKKVHVLKDKVNLEQFVKNIASLKLPESYLNALFLIGNMYGIPKDLLEVLSKGSTYENQEKAVGRYIDYTEMPKVQQFSDFLEVLLDIEEVKGSFKHLPFNQIFEAERKLNKKIEMESLKIAFDMGIDVTKQVQELLDYDN